MVKHTRGPWHVMTSYPGVMSGNEDVAFVGDGEIVTALQSGGDGLAKRHANARLIAAAPDLLAALILARAHCQLRGQVHEIVDAAIAKATGDSP